jgi:aspartate aminotransferase-like enzyme
MRSPFGLGFACLSQRLLEVLDPSYHGYLALAEPEMGWDRYMGLTSRSPFDLLPLRQDAVRLETGGFPNWLGAAALDTAASELESKGQTSVWARIRRLRKRLVADLAKWGLRYLAGSTFPRGHSRELLRFIC